jgi:hypothetical protein
MQTTLPYAEALLKLPSHIQQLDMESNGKVMTEHGIEVNYPADDRYYDVFDRPGDVKRSIPRDGKPHDEDHPELGWSRLPDENIPGITDKDDIFDQPGCKICST